MGGVAVLHPQDSLKDHPTPMKSHRTISFNHTYTNTPCRSPNFIASDSRRRTSTKGMRKKNDPNTEAVAVAVVAETPAAMSSQTVLIGQVKLLKRGEAFNGSSSTSRSEPDPKMLSKPMKNNRSEFFAGSAFADSPPPSSVPLPGFFTKNFVAAVRVDPTTDLRRILGLNLS